MTAEMRGVNLKLRGQLQELQEENVKLKKQADLMSPLNEQFERLSAENAQLSQALLQTREEHAWKVALIEREHGENVSKKVGLLEREHWQKVALLEREHGHEVGLLERELKQKDEQLKEKDAQMSRWKDDYSAVIADEVRKPYQAAISEAKTLKLEKEAVQEKLQIAEKEVLQMKAVQTEKDKAADTLQKAVGTLQKEKDKVKQQHDEMNAERDAMKAGRDAMKAERDAMKAENDQLEAKLVQVEAQARLETDKERSFLHQQFEKDKAEMQAACDKQVAALRAELWEAATKQNESMHMELQQKREALDAEFLGHVDKDAEIKRLKAELERLLEESKDEQGDLQSTLESLTSLAASRSEREQQRVQARSLPATPLRLTLSRAEPQKLLGGEAVTTPGQRRPLASVFNFGHFGSSQPRKAMRTTDTDELGDSPEPMQPSEIAVRVQAAHTS